MIFQFYPKLKFRVGTLFALLFFHFHFANPDLGYSQTQQRIDDLFIGEFEFVAKSNPNSSGMEFFPEYLNFWIEDCSEPASQSSNLPFPQFTLASPTIYYFNNGKKYRSQPKRIYFENRDPYSGYFADCFDLPGEELVYDANHGFPILGSTNPEFLILVPDFKTENSPSISYSYKNYRVSLNVLKTGMEMDKDGTEWDVFENTLTVFYFDKPVFIQKAPGLIYQWFYLIGDLDGKGKLFLLLKETYHGESYKFVIFEKDLFRIKYFEIPSDC